VTGAAEILTELQWRRVSVEAEGDALCLKPRRALDDSLLARIRQAKPAILEVLRGRPVAFCQTEPWPSVSLDAELRFGQPHAKLFPFIGRKVRTPAGPGALLQVFAKRVTVVLDSEMSRCSFFLPAEIQPVSWELP
jgi:hypothetical protein